MANNTEGQLVDIWNEEEESSGVKGWLEENVSRKGLGKAYDWAKKHNESLNRKMDEEVYPGSGVTHGDLYGMTTGVGGFAKILDKSGIKHLIKVIGKDSDELMLMLKQAQKSKNLNAIQRKDTVKKIEEKLIENMTIQTDLTTELLQKNPNLAKEVVKELKKRK